ncbi:MAG: RHS repeat-associated core domain-containing protein [Candidatus Acidiferrales bacterium]
MSRGGPNQKRKVGQFRVAKSYKFEGKERDTETGNDDFGARYYSSRLGRWLSSNARAGIQTCSRRCHCRRARRCEGC